MTQNDPDQHATLSADLAPQSEDEFPSVVIPKAAALPFPEERPPALAKVDDEAPLVLPSDPTFADLSLYRLLRSVERLGTIEQIDSRVTDALKSAERRAEEREEALDATLRVYTHEQQRLANAVEELTPKVSAATAAAAEATAQVEQLKTELHTFRADAERRMSEMEAAIARLQRPENGG